MSIIPAFRIGVWNAWVLLLPLYLIPAVVASGKREPFSRTEPKAGPGHREKSVFVLSKVVLVLALLCSVLLPLRLGTLWFYVGLPTSLFGIAMYVIVSINIARTPAGKPFTKGLYRYSRHPMYVAAVPAFVGPAIAAASWLFLLLSVLLIVTHFMNAIAEERQCLEAYGSTYREYLERTPRWIGLPKS
jgi:protein-S-isoprenylcysteine O-methyltransferase Ste14